MNMRASDVSYDART